MSGALPQDPKVDRVLSELPTELQPIGRRLRELVRRSAPSLRESVKWGNPVWVGNGNVIIVMIFPDHLNLGFWKGAQLSTKYKELEGTGKGWRHVKIRSVKDVGQPVLVKIIHDAVRLDRVEAE